MRLNDVEEAEALEVGVEVDDHVSFVLGVFVSVDHASHGDVGWQEAPSPAGDHGLVPGDVGVHADSGFDLEGSPPGAPGQSLVL